MACHAFEAAERLSISGRRTAEEDKRMLAQAMIAVFHAKFLQDKRMLAAASWLASRVSGLLGHAETSLRLAQTAVGYSVGLPKEFEGFAQEALARALSLNGRTDEADVARVGAIAAAHSLEREFGIGSLRDEILDLQNGIV